MPIPEGVFVSPDPTVSGDGWPAWRGDQPGLLRRDGTFIDKGRRAISLARGAVQEQRRGDRLGRAMGESVVGVLQGCPHDRIVSGFDGRPGRVWWEPCRDTGQLFDLRWDTDGSGVVYLVRRGGRLVFGRSPRPGVQVPIASYPLRAIEGVRALRRGLHVEAVMDGRVPSELRLAMATDDHLWLWSTLRGVPVAVPREKGQTVGFAGFTVSPGEAR